MNFDFRQFMLSAEVSGGDKSQSLLYHTQRMFGQLQSSHRRFIDPEAFVASIKTYDDDLINIHNQMDVEEFFNLLNDRWEGQLRSQETMQRFRSFYGGQLVTQTKSKECEHISEVMEPFSAIQCDIKGKKDLLESLDAYVDGEHMEGGKTRISPTPGIPSVVIKQLTNSSRQQVQLQFLRPTRRCCQTVCLATLLVLGRYCTTADRDIAHASKKFPTL